jgi:trans-aconitate methyltransferase
MYQWNAVDYAQHSQGQERWARELLANIQLRADEQVLDVGCGDGRITAYIATQLPQGRVSGVDLSADMIAHATAQFRQLANLSFQQCDASHLPFDNQFTLVFSNAALHWVRDHQPVLAGISRSLKPGGRFVAQMGGAGNGAAMLASFDAVGNRPPWREYFTDFVSSYGFHHPDDYVRWLGSAGLQVEECRLLAKDMVHANVSAFLGWVRTAWHPYTNVVTHARREQFIAEVVEHYLQLNPVDSAQQVHVQMMRLQVNARKVSAHD